MSEPYEVARNALASYELAMADVEQDPQIVNAQDAPHLAYALRGLLNECDELEGALRYAETGARKGVAPYGGAEYPTAAQRAQVRANLEAVRDEIVKGPPGDPINAARFSPRPGSEQC